MLLPGEFNKMTTAIAVIVVNSLISTRLDYCNNLFLSGCSKNLHFLQFVCCSFVHSARKGKGVACMWAKIVAREM